MGCEYGVLLPHFGKYSDRDRILEGARLAEKLGFDALWVRDHLVFEPHGEMEDANRNFLDALTTLTAVGAVTERIKLGTGSLIPFRHPLHTALTVSTMTHLVGARIILGFGAGTFDREFDAVGLGGVYRPDLLESHVRILRTVWGGDGVSYADDHYQFQDVTIEPKPAGHVPIWYCGNTPASVRRAVGYCEGWMPGRISLATHEARIKMLARLASEQRKPRPAVAVIPPTSIEKDHDAAFKGVNIDGLLRWANKAKYWVKPPSGRFETWQDLEGMLIAGDPGEVAEQARKFDALGTDHLVFDFRFKFDRYLEQIELIGEEVLPQLRSSSV